MLKVSCILFGDSGRFYPPGVGVDSYEFLNGTKQGGWSKKYQSVTAPPTVKCPYDCKDSKNKIKSIHKVKIFSQCIIFSILLISQRLV